MTKENTDWMHDSNSRLVDRGMIWRWCDFWEDTNEEHGISVSDLRQAMHDRDRFQRDAEWWEEECRKRKPTQQDAWETQP